MQTSDIIAASSVVIAVAALVATIYQSWLSRHHSILSVRPLLVWRINRRIGSQPIAGFTFKILNLGLGPALITDRFLSKSGVRFDPDVIQTDEVIAFVEAIFGRRVEYRLLAHDLPARKTAIPSQGEVVVVDIEFPNTPAENLELMLQLAGNMSLTVEYESMYGEKGTLFAHQRYDAA